MKAKVAVMMDGSVLRSQSLSHRQECEASLIISEALEVVKDRYDLCPRALKDEHELEILVKHRTSDSPWTGSITPKRR